MLGTLYPDDMNHTWSMILVAFLVEAVAEGKVVKGKTKRVSIGCVERLVPHSRLFVYRKAGITVNADEYIHRRDWYVSLILT